MNPTFVKESNKTVDMFIKCTDEAKIKRFFMKDIDEKLDKYAPGKPHMKPDVLKQTLEIEEQRKKMVQPTQFLMQQEGKDPVPLGPNEIINLINGLRSNTKVLMDRNSELEKMVQKAVTFSDPIEQPSNNVHKLKKEILELEFKLKHSAIVEAELRSEIEMLREKSTIFVEKSKIFVEKPKVFVEKKKSDPEIQIRL